eukprot:11100687-Alexandrium_andersonii.AAC.1
MKRPSAAPAQQQQPPSASTPSPAHARGFPTRASSPVAKHARAGVEERTMAERDAARRPGAQGARRRRRTGEAHAPRPEGGAGP